MEVLGPSSVDKLGYLIRHMGSTTVLDTAAKDQERVESASVRVPAARRILTLLVIAGALVRFGLVAVFEGRTPEIVDAQDYDRLAVGLVETGRYQDETGRLTSLRPPFYPLLVAGLYESFGLQNYTAVRVAQVLLSLCTMLLVYQLGKSLYSTNVGLWAAGGYAFYPTLLGMNNLVLSEGVFTFFFVAAMLLAVRSVHQPTVLGALGIGICLALGALTRSILWLFSPLFCVLLFFAINAPVKKRFVTAGTVLGAFFAGDRSLGLAKYPTSEDVGRHRRDGRPKCDDGQL